MSNGPVTKAYNFFIILFYIKIYNGTNFDCIGSGLLIVIATYSIFSIKELLDSWNERASYSVNLKLSSISFTRYILKMKMLYIKISTIFICHF